jgi:small-conductance mechanosensitive channel
MTTNFFNLNIPAFWDIMARFAMNLFFLFLLLRVVYYRYTKKADYLFGFFLMGVVIFFIGAMLKIVAMEFQMAVGLFAIFTILNLRTISFDVKNMAYLFAIIAISAMNSLDLRGKFPLLGILIFNIIIIASAYILEMLLAKKDKYKTHPIMYDDMEMLKPQNKKELIQNVSEITGLDIKKVRIRNVNYKSKVAVLDIYYEA